MATWTGGQWTNLRVDMATSAVDYLAASTTFANNLGANAQTVVNGPQVISGGSSLGAGIVVPPHVDVPLATPYLYDPSGGDFLFDVYVDGATWSAGRRSVLQGFLDRPAIYATATGVDRWDTAARVNLAGELAALS